MTPPTLMRADPTPARSDPALRAGAAPQAAQGGGFASQLQDRLSAPERPHPPPARQADSRQAARPDTPRGPKPATSDSAAPGRPPAPVDATRQTGTVRQAARDATEAHATQETGEEGAPDAAPVTHDGAVDPNAQPSATETAEPHAQALPAHAAPTPATDVVAWALQASRSSTTPGDQAHAAVAPAPDAQAETVVADQGDALHAGGQPSPRPAVRHPTLAAAAGASTAASTHSTAHAQAQAQASDEAGQTARIQATAEAADTSAGAHDLHTMMAALTQRHTRPRDGQPGDGSLAAERPVAALSGSTAAAPTTGGGATPTVAHAHLPAPAAGPGFAGALAHQLTVWARDGVQRASLTLNPAELGTVTIKIAMDGTQARVEFAAVTVHARDALQASLPTLAQMFSSSGLSLTGADVHARSSSGQGGEQGAPQGPAHGRHGGGAADSQDALLPVAPPSARRLGGLDLYA